MYNVHMGQMTVYMQESQTTYNPYNVHMRQMTVYSNNLTTMHVCVQGTHGAVESGVKHHNPTSYPKPYR